MTIGEIIDSLSQFEQGLCVNFDFCQCAPTKVDSWRNGYHIPTLGWTPTGYSSSTTDTVTVAALLQELRSAIDGRKYNGWKGGEYTYTRDDDLQVDNPGDATFTEITQIEADNSPYGSVILHTRCRRIS